MKSLRKLLYIIPLTGMMVTSCMDVENIEIDHIGGYATMNNAESEAYYANLRAYKATAWNYNRFSHYQKLSEKYKCVSLTSYIFRRVFYTYFFDYSFSFL